MRKLLLILFFILLLACLFTVLIYIPSKAEQIYGQPAAWLTVPQRVQYSARLLWHDGLLTHPLDSTGGEQSFPIDNGESVNSIATRLQQTGLIRDAGAFRDYLIYSGLDTSIQSGSYQLSAAMSPIDIAHKLQDATSAEVTFVILPGWRMEEIAASLPTSGLPVTPEEFISAAQTSFSQLRFSRRRKLSRGISFP